MALLLTVDANAGEKIRVFVSILPQAELVERVGGERVKVNVLVRPGESPATYSPTPRQLAELSKAKLFIRVGVPFEEGFINKVRETYPKLKIIDQRDNVRLIKAVHDHDHVHDHVHVHVDVKVEGVGYDVPYGTLSARYGAGDYLRCCAGGEGRFREGRGRDVAVAGGHHLVFCREVGPELEAFQVL